MAAPIKIIGGGTYKNHFYLADVHFPKSITSNTIRLILNNDGFAAFFPMANQKARLIGLLPRSLQQRKEVSFNDLKPHLTFSFGVSVPIEQCMWFSTYQLHHRMAESFQTQHCFLIGDAAHIHSPIGGQGLNTGLQDAHNLAWKLAGVINGHLPVNLLESYSKERRPIARNLLQSTDRMFSILVSANPLIKFLGRNLFLKLLQLVTRKPRVLDTTFKFISQLGINYRESPISVHHSSLKHLRAGDRLPFFNFYDEKQGKETNLHQWCSKPGFTLLVMGTLSSRDLFLVAKWIISSYPHHLNFYYLPYSSKNQPVFDFFEMSEHSKRAIIIRPDMHIGYMSDAVIIETMDTYLSETIGWVKFRKDD